jgi:hypothetical protein
VSCKRRIQAGLKNALKVIIKVIEGEGKAPQEKPVGSRQMAPSLF